MHLTIVQVKLVYYRDQGLNTIIGKQINNALLSLKITDWQNLNDPLECIAVNKSALFSLYCFSRHITFYGNWKKQNKAIYCSRK